MKIRGVDTVHWNPRKYRIPRTQLRLGGLKNNFGDLLGPIIARRLIDAAPGELSVKASSASSKRLVAVGSILHLARDGDTIWGSGVNGKVSADEHRFDRLDVRAVRGPLTARWLGQKLRSDIPEIYGDPGLLIGYLYPELKNEVKTRTMSLIPNLNEADAYQRHPDFVSPVGDPMKIIRTIAASEYVVGSSLHSVVVAESLGVAAALVQSEAEPQFKYDDYFQGTGRDTFPTFSNLDSAIEHAKKGSRTSSVALEGWNQQKLLDSFPYDLWEGLEK